MTLMQEVQNLRDEARSLRQENASKTRAWESQKEKSDRLEKENQDFKKEIRALKERMEELEKKLNHETAIKEKYQGMLFKSKKHAISEPSNSDKEEKRKLGGQIGHQGTGRPKPQRIDQEKEVFLEKCPHCQNKLNQSNNFYERIIEDIAFSLNTIITKYRVQRQWCSRCQKEVSAVPRETVENSPFGVNALIWILIQKYRFRLPLESISASLDIQYGLSIGEGTIQKILHKLKKKLGSKYQELIEEIRQNKIKHADETGWRINGENVWCWMFSSPESILYTIEETRGKGVPQKILGESPPGVLIRDDYGAYKNLDLPQQSCWAHLLRNSKEKALKDNSSQEMKDLHAVLKTMFSELSEIVKQKLSAKKRKESHQFYQEKIQAIIDVPYTSSDVQEIQTRIANQNANLITAILFPGVPLTNNAAERNIRKMVVTRKISGGSRSDEGAATHAVNMSIIQTLFLKKESAVSELKKLLAPEMAGLVLEKGE
jgi:transposase/FtsZ-binding cell division protein ZapB